MKTIPLKVIETEPMLSLIHICFLQDVRHNLWDFDQDEVAVANYGSQIQEKYTAK